MTTIQRLTDSCLLVTTDDDASLFDPGFHSFLSGEIEVDSIPDVTRVLVTHQHPDHVHPDFIKWLMDRGSDVTVFSNSTVASILEPHGIEVVTDAPTGVTVEDVTHARIPNGDQPPNRSFTIDGVLTHPGDSREPTISAPILALPLLVPWDSTTGAVDFARRLSPSQVVPIHDFYLNESGRKFVREMAGKVLEGDGIEMIGLDWGESVTI